MEHFFTTLPFGELVLTVALISAVGFSFGYFSFAAVTLLLTRVVLPRLAIGSVLDSRPLKPNQIRGEIVQSLCSIGIFTIYGGLTAALLRLHVVTASWNFSWVRFLPELTALFIWNEVHFFLCHRLLHTSFLFKHVHRAHHASVIPTPFATYSFHWFEATLLGSVMVLIMSVHEFTIWSLASLPVVSLFANVIGHSNYTLFSAPSSVYSASREHALHHRHASGNYGFLLPFFDALCRTKVGHLPDKSHRS